MVRKRVRRRESAKDGMTRRQTEIEIKREGNV